jgi:hypothetical protein
MTVLLQSACMAAGAAKTMRRSICLVANGDKPHDLSYKCNKLVRAFRLNNHEDLTWNTAHSAVRG